MTFRISLWRAIPMLALAISALWPSAADASHFRFGNLNWAPTTNQGQVEFKLTIALRRDETNNYGGPFNAGVDVFAETGDILYDGISNTAFNFGDGTANTPRLNFVVTAFSTNENWLLAEALDPVTSQRGVRHTYLNAGPYQAGINTCCRLGPVALNNRADGNIVVRSLVRPTLGNRSPVSTLVPIITVPIGPAVSFTVPAIDSDQDVLSFRLANDAVLEAGPCCFPPGLSINSTSGVVTWNNIGLNTNRFWTAQVAVEDMFGPGGQGVKSSAPVDFLLLISGNTVPPPTCAISPSNTIVVTPGTPVSFTVSGTGYFGQTTGGTNRIVLNTGGLPAGAMMTPALPLAGGARQGVSSTFSWVPGEAQAGTYPILFTITDEYGGQSLCSINVTVQPVADLAIHKTASPPVLVAGSNITYVIYLSSLGPNTAQGVVLTDILPPGLSNVVVTPSRGSCTVSNRTVTCSLGSVFNTSGNDISASVRITAVAMNGGALTNTASASTTSFDPDLTNNHSTAIVTVIDTNAPPTVVITDPADNAVFTTPPGVVPIEASAQDPDGYVQSVDFYVDGLFLGSDSNAPYALTLTTNVPGLYTLTAIATDNRNDTGTSAPVRVTIEPCDPNLSVAPIPNQTRCLCDEVTFTAIATSTDPVTYAWQHNGVMLFGETNASLILKNLKQAQAGIYTAVVSAPCATTSRSGTLTLKGAGNQNPVSFTNGALVLIRESGSATPYPVPLLVECLPGPVKHLSVTLHGLSHDYPDDIDILLGSPAGAAVRLISDAGGGDNVTNVVLTFTDIATNRVSGQTNIVSGSYAPTDYTDTPADSFPLPAPQNFTTATNFAPFLGTQPNGTWSLFIRDDALGDGGTISNGWRISIEWEDTPPRLADPQVLADGSFRATLHGLPRMTHLVESSFDLAIWEPVSTNTFTAPLVITLPPASGAPPWRFLRAVRCP